MRNISSRIQKIHKDYYLEKNQKRYNSLVNYAQAFAANQPIIEKCLIRVDLFKMKALVDSYFLDVIRFKDYHFNPKSDFPEEELYSKKWNDEVHGEKLLSPPKVAAFTAKWILKYCPLNIMPFGDRTFSEAEEIQMLDATARLAFQFSMVLLGLKVTSIDPECRDRIIYHFRFRLFDDRSFILLFETLIGRHEQDGWAYKDLPIDDELNEVISNLQASRHANDTKSETEEIVTRRDDGKTYSVFVSDAPDCTAEGLTRAAHWALDELNQKIGGDIPKFIYHNGRTVDDQGQIGVAEGAIEAWVKTSATFLFSLAGINTTKIHLRNSITS